MYGHVITKFSGMGRFTKLWGSARGAPLLYTVHVSEIGLYFSGLDLLPFLNTPQMLASFH